MTGIDVGRAGLPLAGEAMRGYPGPDHHRTDETAQVIRKFKTGYKTGYKPSTKVIEDSKEAVDRQLLRFNV